jgi:hypothetical protein
MESRGYNAYQCVGPKQKLDLAHRDRAAADHERLAAAQIKKYRQIIHRSGPLAAARAAAPVPG